MVKGHNRWMCIQTYTGHISYLICLPSLRSYKEKKMSVSSPMVLYVKLFRLTKRWCGTGIRHESPCLCLPPSWKQSKQQLYIMSCDSCYSICYNAICNVMLDVMSDNTVCAKSFCGILWRYFMLLCYVSRYIFPCYVILFHVMSCHGTI